MKEQSRESIGPRSARREWWAESFEMEVKKKEEFEGHAIEKNARCPAVRRGECMVGV